MWVMHPCQTSFSICFFPYITSFPISTAFSLKYNIRAFSFIFKINIINFRILKTFVPPTFLKTSFKIYKRICSTCVFHNYPEAAYRFLGSFYSFYLTGENHGRPILSNLAIERAWLWNVLKYLSTTYPYIGLVNS